MNANHYDLWNICRTFFCAGRDASHGLAHMETVTRQAVLIFMMNHGATESAEFIARNLSRVIVVAMLHDVNDHKYDDEVGTLAKKVKTFLESIASKLVIVDGEAEGCATEAGVVETVMQCTDAISYSKEVKRGMRWFEKTLPSAAWVVVRDSVSDSDKLEAIGYSGLLRCYEFATHLLKGKGKWEAALQEHGIDNIGKALLYPHVVEHSDEKLLRLKDHFVNTVAGKHLALPLHEEMVVGLKQWEMNGPPALSAVGIHA
ncbi:Hypothetical protein, putative [Bodo saltans]|uniref:HD domain-containing protein n=1 Tax=Bodo saltans TaxID=75058 RepID=A0A0S4KI40_BODSA|nr:Hypothetical protein, putative [Bodo saltans]|eukprot:CUI15300.1 Hypothetical protein, putative [Bodo saltans]